MPDESAALGVAPVLRMVSTLGLPENALGRRNLIGAHHQQRVVGTEDGILQEHFQQRVFLEKGRGKVFQVFDQRVVRLRPVHGEVEAVFIPLRRIGKVATVRAIRDHEKLQKLVEGVFRIEALFAVAVHLIEGFTNRHPALL